MTSKIDLKRGQKETLPGLVVDIDCQINAPFEFDMTLFGLDKDGKLSDDRYMIFYNQTKSPDNAMCMITNSKFHIELNHIPTTIRKVALTLSSDDILAKLKSTTINIRVGEQEYVFQLNGKDFELEKSTILLEFYLKDVWKLSSVGQGFNGGLSALLKHYGGVERVEKPRVNLIKLVSEKKPSLISLAKAMDTSVTNFNMRDRIFQVLFILDASGSMHNQYKLGDVQLVVERMLMAGLQFDDDGKAETYAFALKEMQLGDLTLDSVNEYVNKNTGGWNSWMSKLNSAYNNEPVILNRIYEEYKDSTLPVYAIFVSDGGIDKDAEIQRILDKIAKTKIYIQFIGIGGRNYGILETFTRNTKNCNFFALDTIKSISETELFNKMMEPLSKWYHSI